MKKTVRFFNTFSPVVPLYEDFSAPLLRRGIQPRFLISQGWYRNSSDDMAVEGGGCFERCWFPKALRESKRMSSVFYYAMAPIILLFRKADLHVFLTQPPLFFLVGAFLSRLKGVPYGIHLMDMYPDLLVAIGLLKEKGLFYRLLNRMAVNTYQKADFVVVLGRCMRDRLIEKGVPADKIHIVHNWSVIPPSTKLRINNSYREKWGLGSKLVVMYAGNIGIAHDMAPLLEAARQLRAYNDIVFVIVGEGIGRKAVEGFVQRYSLKNVLLRDSQPVANLDELVSSADIHYVTLKAGYEGLMVPSKLYSILACGSPVLFMGSKRSEVARILEQYRCGILCGSESSCIVRYIKRAMHDRSWLEEYGSNAVTAANDVSKEKMIKRYIAIIEGEE